MCKKKIKKWLREENRKKLVGCCGFFVLFGRVLKIVLPNISPVSVAGIYRGQHSVLWYSWLGSGVFLAVRWAFVFFCRWVISVSCCGCIVVIRRRDYLSLWLMGDISCSFVCSVPAEESSSALSKLTL